MSNARNLGNITAGGATGATTASVTTSINNLIDAAPGALNTLNELAAALGDDANFSTTVTNSIATKLPLAGGTLTGDVTFTGDNYNIVFDKSDSALEFADGAELKFGADDDLKIRHDSSGNNSRIIESGTGSLFIQAENLNLKSANAGEFYIKCVKDGAVELYYDNSKKLETTANGIDVTGVGSNFKSASYNILNLQTDTDDNGSSDDGIFKITNGSAGTTKAEFRWDESENTVQIAYGDHGRSIVIDSNDRVGINYSNPATTGAQLTVQGVAGSNAVAVLGNGTSGNSWGMGINAGSTSADASFRVYDKDGSNSYFYVRGDGNVGIGVPSPQQKLQVKESSTSTTSVHFPISVGGSNHVANYAAGIGFDPEGYGSRNKMAIVSEGIGQGYSRGKFHFLLNAINDSSQSTLANSKMTIQDNGNVGIGTTNPGAILHVTKASVPAANTTDTDELVRFGVDGNAHGRIDLHTTAKQSTRRTTVFRTENNDNLGFGYNAYHMGSLDIGRVDQGYTWNGYNGDGEYTSGVMNAPRYIRKAHFSGQILANNTWYTIMENVNDTRFTIECFCGDASSRDYKKYGGYYTSPAYGVYGLSQLLQVNGGWNSGSFNMRVAAPNGNLSIDLQFSSYYNSANVASWFCIYTCFV